VDSPVGPLTLVCSDGVLSGLYLHEQRHRPAQDTFGTRDGRGFAQVVEQLAGYFRGELTAFDLPLRMTGSPFQQRVWAELRRVPYGQTRSYGQLALTIGSPTASRAVGLANGRNPISIIVPCHRIVGSTGRLTGYGGGLQRKQQLLDHERAPGQPQLLQADPVPSSRPSR
jgi:methylated-DNA-[protein]-cysteine S-methyltransferase